MERTTRACRGVTPCPVGTRLGLGLMAFASGYLSEKMIAGNILNAVQQVRVTDSGYCLHGRYACLEMIGKERREQNGDIYGKSS